MALTLDWQLFMIRTKQHLRNFVFIEDTMQTPDLENAVRAVSEIVENSDQPMEVQSVLEQIGTDKQIKNTDFREAVWFLISQGEIALTWDFKLTKHKPVETATRGV